MGRFRESFARFMYGRYGMDTLYYALLVLYVAVLVVGIFVHSWIVSLLLLAIAAYAFFRVLSRNIARRSAENAWFTRRLDSVKRKFRLLKLRFSERKTHAYKSCPHCHAVIRLARVKGQHTCTCPRCRQDFSVRL